MTLQVVIDWQNNGDWDDAIDDISADVISAAWKIGFRQAYQDMADESQAKIVLTNETGKYTPENASGALYGYLLPHRRMQIRDIQAGGTVVLWTGWVEFPQVKWQAEGAATAKTEATILGIGAKSLLQDVDVQLPIYTDTTGDVIVADVLEQSVIPPAVTGVWILGQAGSSELGESTYLGDASDYSSVEAGITIFPVYGDQEAANAWEVIKQVTEGERGRFWFDRDGKAIWWNRHHLLLDTTNDATVNSASGDYKPRQLGYKFGRYMANIVRVEARPRATGSSEVLYTLDAPVTVPAGQTVSFDVTLRKTSDGEFAGASSLSETPTFSSGSGSVTATANGGNARVTVVNNSSTADAVLSALTLSGAPSTAQNNIIVEDMDTDGVIEFGKREFRLSLGPLGTYADAIDVAHFELLRRKDARGAVDKIEFRRLFDGGVSNPMIDWTVGTRVNVVLPELGHDTDYFVVGEEHIWRPGQGGGVHDSTFRLEPAAVNAFWVLGDAGFSELGETTWLAY
jgi:hypothetical protein